MSELKNQPCPVCGKEELVLKEENVDIPYFGKAAIFSMHCENCHFSKSDIEAIEEKTPVKITFEITSKEDMNIRVVKSSNALVKIPQLRMSMEPGESSNGFISNMEGLLNKFEKVLEGERDSSEEKSSRKKAKNLLKKIWKVKLGEISLKIIIKDKSGNSAIISDKSKVEKLKE